MDEVISKRPLIFPLITYYYYILFHFLPACDVIIYSYFALPYTENSPIDVSEIFENRFVSNTNTEVKQIKWPKKQVLLFHFTKNGLFQL